MGGYELGEESDRGGFWGFGSEGERCVLLRGASCFPSPTTQLFADNCTADRRETGSNNMAPSLRPFPASDTNTTTTRLAPIFLGIHDFRDTGRSRRGSGVGQGLETQTRTRGRGLCSSGACLFCERVGVVARAAVSVWVSCSFASGLLGRGELIDGEMIGWIRRM